MATNAEPPYKDYASMHGAAPQLRTEVGEKAVLGAVILDPSKLAVVRQWLQVADFGYVKHQHIYIRMCLRADNGEPFNDQYLLIKDLEQVRSLGMSPQDIAGLVASLDRYCEQPENVEAYCHEVLKYALKAAIRDKAEIAAGILNRGADADAVEGACATAQARIDDIRRRLQGETEDTSLNSQFALSQRQPPAPMRLEAYYGLAGDVVRAIAPHTEADPDGILVQFLAIFGAYAGRKTCFKVSADRHYPNLYAVLVGDTASGRKGMSWGAARYIFTKIPVLDDWPKEHTIGGMSSGEGLIHPVRDYREVGEGEDTEEGKKRPPEPLRIDKRVLVRESEFSSVLKMPTRDGNNLSEVQRRAWDGDVLQTLTKNSPERATGAHITIVGNITREELARYLSQTDTANGFANRYLWVHVARARLLPDGGDLDSLDLSFLIERLKKALQSIEKLAEHHVMARDNAARELWHEHYERLTTTAPGLFGAMTARAAAQVMRLAMIYALLDCEQVIRVQHLEAALAVWEYVENSVRYLFGDALGDPIADTILRKLRATPEGVTRTAISELLGRHAKATDIDRALALLQEHRFARYEKGSRVEGEKGRPTERWFSTALTANTANVRNAKEANKIPPEPGDDIISHNSHFAASQRTPFEDRVEVWMTRSPLHVHGG